MAISKKAVIKLLIIASFLLTSVGCEPADVSTEVTLVDDVGRVITIQQPVKSIISIATPNTEILFALGLGQRVIGVSKYCNYPPEALEVEEVGSVLNLYYERIAELSPDLVLAGGHTTQDAITKLEGLGIPVVILDPRDIEGIFADIELVGKLTATENEADSLVSQLRERKMALLSKTKNVNKPRVFIQIDPSLRTAGPGSFIDELINLAGGSNIAAGSALPYPMLSSEKIIELNPEIIILADTDLGTSPETVKAQPGWGAITAVKNDDIYTIDRDIISRAGPRVIDGLEALIRIIHPELRL